MKRLLVFLVVMLMATSVMAQGLFPLSESQCDCGPAGCSQAPVWGQPSTSGWRGSTQQAVPPMVRQYQGLQQVAPRGPSGGFITIGDPATVYVPNAPPVPDPDPRLGLSVRDDVRRQQREIADLKRTKADGGQILPVQMGTPPGVSTDQQANGFMTNLEATNRVVMDLDTRIAVLENALAAAREMIDGVDPDKIKTEIGQQLYDQAQQARTEANAAADKLQKAAEEIVPAAKAAAKDEVDKAMEDPSILKRLSDGLGLDGLVSDRLEAVGLEKTAGGVRWLWGLIIGTWVGYGFLLVIAGAIVWDIWAKLKYGHPLFLQTVTELAKKATPYIPTRIDDRLVNAADAGVDAAADAAAEKVRGWFGIELQQAVAEGVKQGVAAANAKKGK